MQSIYFADPQKIIIVMVGLPARGKSYISKKISRFLNWLGYDAEVFNIGNYRRSYMEIKKLPLEVDYFDNDNQHYKQQREEIANFALNDLVEYINTKGNIAILDGTNSTKERRRNIKQCLAEKVQHKYFLFLIQSVCQDKNVIQTNITKVKVYSPDYVNKNPDFISQDFHKRINFYEKYYETVQKSEGIPFLKTINIGCDFSIHSIRGYLPQKITTFVMNLTISAQRIIYLLRHGETTYNLEDRIGGNPDLSQDGKSFSRSLQKFFQLQQFPKKQQSRILTSTLKRTIQTAKYIKLNDYDMIHLKVLDQINAGICETLTYSEIEQKYPEISKQREADKLRFRYPSGQSYLDLISRIQSVIHWIQRQKSPIVIVSHQAVLRCIYAYFFQTQQYQIPYIPIDLHTVIKLIPQTYFYSQQKFYLDLQENKVQKVLNVKKKQSVDITMHKINKYKKKSNSINENL